MIKHAWCYVSKCFKTLCILLQAESSIIEISDHGRILYFLKYIAVFDIDVWYLFSRNLHEEIISSELGLHHLFTSLKKIVSWFLYSNRASLWGSRHFSNFCPLPITIRKLFLKICEILFAVELILIHVINCLDYDTGEKVRIQTCTSRTNFSYCLRGITAHIDRPRIRTSSVEFRVNYISVLTSFCRTWSEKEIEGKFVKCTRSLYSKSLLFFIRPHTDQKEFRAISKLFFHQLDS